MKDIIIYVDINTAHAKSYNYSLGNFNQNLQNKLKFEMTEKINGIAWLEYQKDDDKYYALMEEYDRGYEIDIKSTLLTNKTIQMNLRITSEENPKGVPVFVSNIVVFNVENTINAFEQEVEEYPSWIDIANSKILEMDSSIQNSIEISQNVEQKGEYAESKGEYAKSVADNIINIKNNGEFDGATFIPNVDSEGNLSWTNNKGLNNPTMQNIRGPIGPTGPRGEAFQIKKTYPSIEAMNNDFDNMQLGDYVMITSNIELEDNAKLFSHGEIEWIFITDFSGAQGIKGEKGDTGEQGMQGKQGVGISDMYVENGNLYITLTNNVNINAGLIITDDVKTWLVTEITNNAESNFNEYFNNKTDEFDSHVTDKITEFDDNATNRLDEYNNNADSLINKTNYLENVIKPLQVETDYDNEIVVENAVEYPLQNLNGKGRSEQLTTTGKNLCYIEVGDINQDGTDKINANAIRSNYFGVLPNQKYVCSYDGVSLNTTIYEYDINKNFIKSTYTNEIVTSNNTSIIRFRIYNNDYNLSLFQFEKDNITSFEPYTGGQPSPNPDYSQTVNSINGSRNLANITSKSNYNYNAILEGQTVKINGTSSESGNVILYLNNEEDLILKANEKYTITIFTKGIVTGTGYKKVYFFCGDSSQNIGYLSSNGKIIYNIQTDVDKLVHFISLDIDSNIIFDNYELKIQIEKGEISHDYIEYNCIQYKNQGKNLFDKNKLTIGKFINSLGEEANYYSYSLSDFINVLSNSTYSYQGITEYSEYGAFYDKNKNLISVFQENVIVENQHIITPSNAKYVRFTLINNNEDINHFIFQKGEIATNYESYKESILNIPLNNNKFRSIGDVCDELIIDTKTGDYYKLEKIKEYILSGNENLTKNDSSSLVNDFGEFKIYKEDMKLRTKIISENFLYSTEYNNSKEYIRTRQTNVDDRNIYISINLNRINNEFSQVNFKRWVNDNNIILNYELENPTLTKIGTLTQEQLEKLVLFDGYNDVSVETNLGLMDIKIKYVQDLKSYLNSIITESNNLINEIND